MRYDVLAAALGSIATLWLWWGGGISWDMTTQRGTAYTPPVAPILLVGLAFALVALYRARRA
jgi:hypothetical protein